jgi:hypothetical protein
MSAPDVTSQADTNAQSAQDVQNMLAELKGGDKPEIPHDTITNETSEDSHAKDGVINDQKPEVAEPNKPNGTTDIETKTKDEEVKEDKKEDADAGDRKEESRGHRPYRGGGRGRGSGRGRGDFKNFKQNIKSDLTNQEETDDPIQIRRQVT